MEEQLTKEQVFSVMEFAQGLYGRFQSGVYTPDSLNQTLIDLNNSPLTPTYDKVVNALEHPIDNAELLQGYSTWATYSDSIYAKTKSYFDNLLSFDLRYVCTNASKKDYKTKEYKEDLGRVYKYMRSLDYKREFKKMVNEMTKTNVVFTWLRDNNSEEYPQRALQMMPQNYCKITGNSAICPTYDFDMAYFLNPSTSLKLYPPIFMDYYNNTFGVNYASKYLPSNSFNKRDGTFAYWTQTSPSKGAWVFSFTDGNYNKVPPFSYLLRTSILNPEIESLQRDKDIISAYGLLFGEMETSEKGKSGQMANNTVFDSKTMGQFLQLIASGLNKRLKPLAFPLKEVELKQFTDSNTDMSIDQYKTSSAQGASASSLIYTDSKMGVEEFKNALYTDYLYMSKIYPQFDTFLNYFVNQKTRKFKFKFKFEGSNYPLIREQMTDKVKDLASVGISGNMSIWEQAFGYDLGELDTMSDESIDLNKLQLMLNSNTTSQNETESKGRPRKKAKDLGEMAEEMDDYR